MTKPILTTSWDDGHPLDLRVAEMLSHHRLTGTFYIPRRDIRPVMADVQVRSLSDAGFEVGAHTLDHVVLTRATDNVARRQITDSRQWVGDVTGQPCAMFCPPCGKHTARHVEMIRDAGYLGYRTVELWSTDKPRRKPPTRALGSSEGSGGHTLIEMPTSIQAQPHGVVRVSCNLLKRTALHNACHFLRHGLRGDWTTHAAAMIQHALRHHGVFHLWGHSWELEDQQQWDRLDQTLALMSTHLDRSTAMTNGQACLLHSPAARTSHAYRKPVPRPA